MGHGPPPKKDKVRRNKEVRTTIAPVEGEGRALPRCPYEAGWIDEVVQWWAAWVESPMASQFLETDWLRLEALAPLVQLWWAGQDLNAFKELRIQEAQFGATVADRLRLKWDVAPKVDREAAVRPSVAARDRLKIVG